MFEKILVPLDGSQVSNGILPYVSYLARKLGAEVVVLNVVDPNSIDEPWPLPSEAKGTLYRKAEENAARELSKHVGALMESGVKSKVIATTGAAAESVLRVASEEKCDLIAMSTHGRNFIARGILGSVTDRVLHASKVPVLTITPDRAAAYRGHGTTFTRLMVLLDGSPLAEKSLPIVEDLARRMSLEVVLVRAVNIGGFYDVHGYTYPGVSLKELEVQLQAEASEYLGGIAGRLRSRGLKTSITVLKGLAATEIAGYARSNPTDLIVLTTHGRSGIKRWVMGSVAEAVVRSSGDPVLVVPNI